MTLYTIDDGTGKVLAKYWTPNDDDEYVSGLCADELDAANRSCFTPAQWPACHSILGACLPA